MYSTVLSLYNAIFGIHKNVISVISEPCYKGSILQRNYRKMTSISWSFSYNSFVKFHVKKIWSHMIVLYLNPGLQIRVHIGKLFSLFLIQNIEPPQ